MTLEEVKTNCDHRDHHTTNRSRMAGNTWIVNILTRAQREHRLVCGMYRAAKSLEKNAENIIACILPLNHSNDAGVQMLSILLEAFCTENHIPVLKIDSEEKLANILREDAGTESSRGRRCDYGCVLLLHANNERSASKCEKHLLQMHAEAQCTFVADLPVP